jgi:hypothetical protein
MFDWKWNTPIPDARNKRKEAVGIRQDRLRRLRPHAKFQKEMWEKGGALPEHVVAAMRAQGRSPTRRGRRVLCEGSEDQQKGLLAMLLQEGDIVSAVTLPWHGDERYLERWIEREDIEEEDMGRMVPMMDPDVTEGALEWGQLQAEGSGVEATTGVEEFCDTCCKSHMRGSNEMTTMAGTFDHYCSPESSEDEDRTIDLLDRMRRDNGWDRATRKMWSRAVHDKPFCPECKTWMTSPWGHGCKCWRYCESCPGVCTNGSCIDPRGPYLCGCSREHGRFRTVWKTPRKGQDMAHWINPCPEDHYNSNDTRHKPSSYQHDKYATRMSEGTTRHVMREMREMAAMSRDEATVISTHRSEIPEQRGALVRRMWSSMGPGSEAGREPRDLTDEEVRMMGIMMTQGDWPPEMVAGAEAHEWETE